MTVKCPKCNKKTEWKNNEWRPFCSKRCKMLDLGAWASDEYAIAGDETLDESSEAHGNDEETRH